MLALVKKPHIELSLHGENVSELVDWIRKKEVAPVARTARRSSVQRRGLVRAVGWACQGSVGQWCLG